MILSKSYVLILSVIDKMNNNNAKLGFKQTVYAGYIGYIVQSIVNNLAPLLFLIFRDTYSIPLSKITLIVTVNFLIQLAL